MGKPINQEIKDSLLKSLKARFDQNRQRHENISWTLVLKRLEEHPHKWGALYAMEISGGEPDVIGQDQSTGELLMVDCSPESPSQRRSLCYDLNAFEERKENRPVGNVLSMAVSMGIELLDETHYRLLQTLGEFDLKTSSWIKTPESIRRLGGALFADRRYNHVFVYHNGASSYYAARGFRGLLRI